MSIRPEYLMHFECDEGEPSLKLSANELDDGQAVWLEVPLNSNHRDERLLQLKPAEALELKAILSVLTDTATPEEEALVGVVA